MRSLSHGLVDKYLYHMSWFNFIGHIVHFIFKMAPNHNVIIHIHRATRLLYFIVLNSTEHEISTAHKE